MRKSDVGEDRAPTGTQRVGGIGGCRQTGDADGLVPKTDRKKFDKQSPKNSEWWFNYSYFF
jgi:hypothetical protein